jgi:uncharacterized protein YecE (DUF72 family)
VIYIGTSGWQYRSWRGVLYPRSVPQSRWLEHYAAHFQTVEVNNTFYRLPEASVFADWRAETPSDFQFALKVSQFLTHRKRLREPVEAVQRFLEHASPLESKLGPLLLQLPPNLKAEPARLQETLECFPRHVRVAVEFRHPSWFTDEVRALLERRNVALCLADRRSRLQSPLWRTADWGYLRMHEGRATPRPGYGRAALEGWARRLGDAWDDRSDVYVFFNNDPLGCAVRNARTFARAVERAGHPHSRLATE